MVTNDFLLTRSFTVVFRVSILEANVLPTWETVEQASIVISIEESSPKSVVIMRKRWTSQDRAGASVLVPIEERWKFLPHYCLIWDTLVPLSTLRIITALCSISRNRGNWLYIDEHCLAQMWLQVESGIIVRILFIAYIWTQRIYYSGPQPLLR